MLKFLIVKGTVPLRPVTVEGAEVVTKPYFVETFIKFLFISIIELHNGMMREEAG